MRRAINLVLLWLIVVVAGCDDGGTGYVQIRVSPASTVAAMPLYLQGTRLDFARGPTVTLQFKTGSLILKGTDSTWAPAICKIVVRKDRISTLTVTGAQNQQKCVCEIRAPDSTSESVVCT